MYIFFRFVFDENWHKETFTEMYGMDKFGAFWMDYLYTMNEPLDRQGITGWIEF